jgi:hypothetical protein
VTASAGLASALASQMIAAAMPPRAIRVQATSLPLDLGSIAAAAGSDCILELSRAPARLR